MQGGQIEISIELVSHQDKKRELKDIDATGDYQYHIYIGHFHHVWLFRSGHFNSLNTLHIHSFVEVYIAVSLC